MSNICDYENSIYRTAFWEGQGREYEDCCEHLAVKRLLPRGDRLLELGAGFGRMADLYGGYQNVVLVDYSHSQLEYARDHLGTDRFRFVAADIYHLPFAPAQFDTITMIRTLHHMEEPLAALQQVRAALRSGGTYIVEYPNARNLLTVSRWLLSKVRRSPQGQDSPFTSKIVQASEMYYTIHPSYARELLRQAGLSPKQHRAVGYLRPKFFKRCLPTRVAVSLDNLLQLTGSIYSLSPSVFVRAQATGQDEQAPQGSFWRCPACCGFDLVERPDEVFCNSCQTHWPIENNIYDFRPQVNPKQRKSIKEIRGW